MKKLITLHITFFIFCASLSAQFITKLDYNQYTYEGEIYKKQDLSFAFEDGTESHRIYKEALKLGGQSKRLMRSAALLFVTGNILLFNGPLGIGLISGYIIAPIFALLAIPAGIGSRSKFQKAFQMHTIEYYEIHGSPKDQSHLDLGVSTNGFGLFYTF